LLSPNYNKQLHRIAGAKVKHTGKLEEKSQPPEKRTDKLHSGAIITITHGNDRKKHREINQNAGI